MASAKSNRAAAQINRRSLLSAAPAFGLAGLMAGAVPVQAETETPIMALYREFKAHSEAWANMPFDISMEEEDRQTAIQRQIETRIMALPSRDARDMAIKMIVGHGFGDHSCLDFDGPVWAEARALIAA